MPKKSGRGRQDLNLKAPGMKLSGKATKLLSVLGGLHVLDILSRIALLEIPPLWLTILCRLGASRMDFPRPGKIIPCLCGRIHGFVGLAGQKAYVMNFRRPTKKLLACLATDVAGLAAERLPMNFSRPEKSYGLCLAKGNNSRLGVFGCAGSFHYCFPKENDSPMNFPGLGKIIRPVSGRSAGFDGLDGQKANMMNFRWAIEKHQACLATDGAGSRHASQ